MSNIEAQGKEVLDLRDDVEYLKKEVRRLARLLEISEGKNGKNNIPQIQESIGEISSSDGSCTPSMLEGNHKSGDSLSDKPSQDRAIIGSRRRGQRESLS